MLNKFKFVIKTWLNVFEICGFNELPKFIKDYRNIKKVIDKRIKCLQKYKVSNAGESYEKYLDTDYWVLETLLRVYTLGLHNSKLKLQILDLGTGIGYFPFICNYFGHYAESIDLGVIELYDLAISALEVKRYNENITAFKELDINKKYDLITAFMICFNGHKTDDLWHIEEWKFFLKALKQKNLLKNGEIFLSFNEEHDKLDPYNTNLLKYFSDHGSTIHKNTVKISECYNF